MNFGLSLPLGHIEPKGDFQTGEAVRVIAQAMEKAGVTGAGMSEHPAPSAEWLKNDPTGHDCLDPLSALPFVAAATTRLKIYSNILVLPFRNPFLTAKAATTLQLLSDNRFIMGVGTGYQKQEFDALGADFHKRGKLTDEALDVIDLIWSGDVVVKQGANFNATGNLPRPAPSPRPPIWVGGASDKALERAARAGDGWLPYFSVPTSDPVVAASSVSSYEQFAEKIEQAHEMRAKFGRSGSFDVAVGSPFRPKSATKADAEQYVEAARKVAACGGTWIWTPLPSPSRSAFLENVAWFGEEVIAAYARG